MDRLQTNLLPREGERASIERRKVGRPSGIICSHATGRHRDLLAESAPTLAAYAQRHGWSLVLSCETLGDRPASWTKLILILAEIGTDMSRFPTAGHLASWAGMCPGNNESAGKHHSGRTRHGDKWLRIALVEAAHAAGRSKNTYLGSQYHQIRGRRGPGRAAVAVGHSILVICWHLLSTGETYTDLGNDYFDKRRTSPAQQRHLVAKLEAMGLKVTLEPAA